MKQTEDEGGAWGNHVLPTQGFAGLVSVSLVVLTLEQKDYEASNYPTVGIAISTLPYTH